MHASRRIGPIFAASTLAVLYGVGVGATSGQRAAARSLLAPVTLVLPVEAVRLAPGGSYQGSARVFNTGAVPADVALFAAQAVDESNGAVGLVPTHRWIRISTYGVRVRPRGAARFTFAVAVPSHTPPGMYVLALAAQEKAMRRRLGMGALAVGYRSVSLLVVVVPGPMTVRLRTEDWVARPHASTQSDQVRVRLTNGGNAYTYAAADLTVRAGRRMWRAQGATVLILAHASVDVTFVVPWRVLRAHAVGTVTVRDGTGSETLSGTLPLPLPRMRRAPQHLAGAHAQSERGQRTAPERKGPKDGSFHDR